MLPRVKVIFVDGYTGASSKVTLEFGLLASAVAVAETFLLNKAYAITKLDDLATLGITSDVADVNANIYKTVKDFYTEAKDGTKLWIYGALNTVSMSSLCDKDGTHVKALTTAANGAIRTIMVSKVDPNGYAPVILDGLDSDVYSAKTKAQMFGEWITENRFAPLFFVLPGRHYAGNADALANLFEDNSNRVAIMIGDTKASSPDAAVGILVGRLAAIPLRRKLMRVMTGKLNIDNAYIGADDASVVDPTTIDSKGFITFRKHIGKAGYFFTNDYLATDNTSDFSFIPRRRVIDEAYRLAYIKTIEILGQEFEVNDDGCIPTAIIKSIENEIATYIETSLGEDIAKNPDNPNDTGVKVYIDSTQNILAENGFEYDLSIRPFGYADYIDVKLHYSTQTV